MNHDTTNNLTFPQKFYLAFVACPENYKDSCPEYRGVTWYHLLWVLVPIAGIVGFYQSVQESYHG